MSLTVLILAAGKSKRIQSKTSKILHCVGNLPVIDHVKNIALSLNPKEILYVVSPHLAHHFENPIIQDPPQGTGDAVRIALDHIKGERVLILYGDVPLWKNDFLKEMLNHPMSLLSMHIENPHAAYGRITLQDHHVQDIKEYKHLSPEEKKNPLMNTGICLFETQFLKENISHLQKHEEEFYLTDIVKIAYEKGVPCVHVRGPVLHGINTREDLAKAEKAFQDFKRQKALQSGVTLISPETVFFSYDTHLSKDCHIDPFVTFGLKVFLEENVKILSFSHLEHTHIHSESIVGPFAHLREGVVLKKDVHIGNFVEIKASHIDEKTRIKHLSYIGDATVGKKVNIGAGTITCNYNGYKKFKTTIEEGVFIGSNSILIAPITLEKESYIAAGTVVTESVPSCHLAISRTKIEFKKRKQS